MTNVNRRTFLRGSALAAAAIGIPTVNTSVAGEKMMRHAPPSGSRLGEIVDVNVSLSHWPFRRVPGDEPTTLADILRKNGVQRAWAGSYDALFHKDVAAVNARLHEMCATNDLFEPVGAINPKLPDWEFNLEEVDEKYGMLGIRLHPNYHLYDLDHPEFVRLLERAGERNLIVQIAVVMEDARTQHPLVRVPPVDVEPLRELVDGLPDLRIILSNIRNEVPRKVMIALADTGQVYFDIARAESAGPVERLLETVPASRVLFGSHAPFFYHHAAVLKMDESLLSEAQRAAITRENAASLQSRPARTN